MSAHIVADETINRVVVWLSWEITRSPYLKETLEEMLGIDTTAYKWYGELGNAIFHLNIAGVESRYGVTCPSWVVRFEC